MKVKDTEWALKYVCTNLEAMQLHILVKVIRPLKLNAPVCFHSHEANFWLFDTPLNNFLCKENILSAKQWPAGPPGYERAGGYKSIFAETCENKMARIEINIRYYFLRGQNFDFLKWGKTEIKLIWESASVSIVALGFLNWWQQFSRTLLTADFGTWILICIVRDSFIHSCIYSFVKITSYYYIHFFIMALYWSLGIPF